MQSSKVNCEESSELPVGSSHSSDGSEDSDGTHSEDERERVRLAVLKDQERVLKEQIKNLGGQPLKSDEKQERAKRKRDVDEERMIVQSPAAAPMRSSAMTSASTQSERARGGVAVMTDVTKMFIGINKNSPPTKKPKHEDSDEGYCCALAENEEGASAGSTTGATKCKEESIAEKKQDLDKLLQNVSGQIGAHTTMTASAASNSTTTNATTTNATSPNKKTWKEENKDEVSQSRVSPDTDSSSRASSSRASSSRASSSRASSLSSSSLTSSSSSSSSESEAG